MGGDAVAEAGGSGRPLKRPPLLLCSNAWQALLGGRSAFVRFYAPWCGHSQAEGTCGWVEEWMTDALCGKSVKV